MKQYFRFEGTAKRQEYWAVIILAYVLSFSLGFIMGGLMVTGATGLYLGVIGLIAVIVAGFWVQLATTIRRCRDADISPWWTVLIYVPYINIVAIIVYGAIGSKESSDA